MTEDRGRVAAVEIGELTEDDVVLADRIVRLAFGTFLGLQPPESFAPGASYARHRRGIDPGGAIAARARGRLVGSNFLTDWGAVGFFGPLTVHPDLWNKGVARALLDETMNRFARRPHRHLGLYTFSNSPKHIALYDRYGFRPRFLTASFVRRLETDAGSGSAADDRDAGDARVVRWTRQPAGERERLAAGVRSLTDELFEGLDVSQELRAVSEYRLGDALVMVEGSAVTGLAICHLGEGSEAGRGASFIKFACVSPGPGGATRLHRLLAEAGRLGAESGLDVLTFAASTGGGAYDVLRSAGDVPQRFGVTMHRPNAPAYHRPELLVLDDWR